ncbi:MAG: lasso peptide biosynthesis B2 protein [Emcibacter sp.]|nr:lasso peptide biosynthesis B2 protein [Emcibacter sp.]
MNVEFLKDIRHRYFLAKHIFYSNIDGHFIVLDLRKNKYLLLGEEEKQIFQVLFEKKDVLRPNEPHDLEQSITDLVELGMLTDGPEKGKQNMVPVLPLVTQDMNGYPFDGIPKIGAGHVYQCFKAFLYTKIVWWLNPMEGVIAKMKNRKTRHLAKKPPKVSFEQTRELVEIFRILTGLFYTVRNECLFDSLTMVNFLASYGIYPQMVFGLQMGPFAAHAWVQEGAISYNCPVAIVDSFEPIMTV